MIVKSAIYVGKGSFESIADFIKGYEINDRRYGTLKVIKASMIVYRQICAVTGELQTYFQCLCTFGYKCQDIKMLVDNGCSSALSCIAKGNDILAKRAGGAAVDLWIFREDNAAGCQFPLRCTNMRLKQRWLITLNLL